MYVKVATARSCGAEQMTESVQTVSYARVGSPWQLTGLNVTAMVFGGLLAPVAAVLPDWFFTGKGFVPWQWTAVMVVWVISSVVPIAAGIECLRRRRRLLTGGWAIALLAILLGCANVALGWKMCNVANDRWQTRWEASHGA